MADPDLQITGGEGGVGHPDPEIRGAQASVWSKNKKGPGPQAPQIHLGIKMRKLVTRFRLNLIVPLLKLSRCCHRTLILFYLTP